MNFFSFLQSQAAVITKKNIKNSAKKKSKNLSSFRLNILYFFNSRYRQNLYL